MEITSYEGLLFALLEEGLESWGEGWAEEVKWGGEVHITFGEIW